MSSFRNKKKKKRQKTRQECDENYSLYPFKLNESLAINT